MTITAVGEKTLVATPSHGGPDPVVAPGPVAHRSLPLWQLAPARMVAGFGVAAVAIALMAYPRYPTPGAADSAPSPREQPDHPATVAPGPLPTTAPARLAEVVPPPRALKAREVLPPTEKPSVRTSRKPDPARTVTTIAAVSAVDRAVEDASGLTKPAASESIPDAPSPPPTARTPSPVTITGCLEISSDGDEFRLADTEGADAPKSRSWRTGFLKKRVAPLTLVGIPDPLTLKKSVGKRVTATGQLAGRELTMSSFGVVGPSCD